MKFWYKKFGKYVRPVIPVILRNAEKSVRYEALVDSGADICIFHTEIGELLNIDSRKGRAEEVFGIGGKASFYYLHDILIEVGGWPFAIQAGFMPSVGGQVMNYGVLGQRGFFENFIVKFDLAKYEIELKNRNSGK